MIDLAFTVTRHPLHKRSYTVRYPFAQLWLRDGYSCGRYRLKREAQKRVDEINSDFGMYCRMAEEFREYQAKLKQSNKDLFT